MLTKKNLLSWKVMLSLAIGCLAVPRAQAQSETSTGIWVYSTNMTITLVNLTYGTLYAPGGPESSVWGKDGSSHVPFNIYSGFSLAPFHSATWRADTDHAWQGHIVFRSTFQWWSAGNAWGFYLNFHPEESNHWWNAGYGTWVSISPASAYWCAGVAAVCGISPGVSYWPHLNQVYTTSYSDRQMHNIMVLQAGVYAQVSLSLYSPDNKNLVVVLRETAALQQAGNADYSGWRLDWVDNDGDSVPGH